MDSRRLTFGQSTSRSAKKLTAAAAGAYKAPNIRNG